MTKSYVKTRFIFRLWSAKNIHTPKIQRTKIKLGEKVPVQEGLNAENEILEFSVPARNVLPNFGLALLWSGTRLSGLFEYPVYKDLLM